ncbi:MAG: Mrp/NBP35 family ATP-binding protein [Chloroflexota bacterium]|nr:Mrp/NBP35 family ATP-binding protein [Chloroflexota bacterium]
MDEASIRALLLDDTGIGDELQLNQEQIRDVVIEGSWLAVQLDPPAVTRMFPRRVYDELARRLPDLTIEVRAGNMVHRGGVGFGPGRHVIAVLGGKGGVGKSTLAVNLALTLAAMGIAVGVVDADLNAPDLPHLLGVRPAPPKEHPGESRDWELWTNRILPPSRWRQPHQRLGLEVMSIGFEVPERAALAATGRTLVSALLRHLLFDVAWTADVLLIDAPPGTGDELQVMAGELPLSGAIFVTTPRDLAQMDAARTLSLLTAHNVPVIGAVQNMSSLICPHCQRPVELDAHSARLTEAGVTLIGQIPFDLGLSVAADRGVPLVLANPRGPVAYELAKIGRHVQRWLHHQAMDGGAGLADT